MITKAILRFKLSFNGTINSLKLHNDIWSQFENNYIVVTLQN